MRNSLKIVLNLNDFIADLQLKSSSTADGVLHVLQVVGFKRNLLQTESDGINVIDFVVVCFALVYVDLSSNGGSKSRRLCCDDFG